MKHLKTLQIVVMLIAALEVNAFGTEVNGIYYYFDNDNFTAEVTFGHGRYTGNISIPETVENEDCTYTVTSIGKQAFYGCPELFSVKIPSSVTSIGDFAFQYCGKLKEVNIPNGVRQIGTDAFDNCMALESVVLPGSIQTMGYNCFHSCTALKKVTIMNGCQMISPLAFGYCKNLSSVVIGKDVKEIGKWAFYSDDNIKEVYFYAVDLPTTDAPFEEADMQGATLYVPASAIEKYKNTEPWNGFGAIVPIGQIPAGVLTTRYDTTHLDSYYSLDGKLLFGKPERAGVYIKNGKKIIIKQHD